VPPGITNFGNGALASAVWPRTLVRLRKRRYGRVCDAGARVRQALLIGIEAAGQGARITAAARAPGMRDVSLARRREADGARNSTEANNPPRW
jgi:hypothetical protein